MNELAALASGFGVSSESAVSEHIDRINAVESELRRAQKRQRVALRSFFRKAPLVVVLLIAMNRTDVILGAVLLMVLFAIAIYAAETIQVVELRRKHDAVASGLDSLN